MKKQRDPRVVKLHSPVSKRFVCAVFNNTVAPSNF